jgi:hypothetical protein
MNVLNMHLNIMHILRQQLPGGAPLVKKMKFYSVIVLFSQLF